MTRFLAAHRSVRRQAVATYLDSVELAGGEDFGARFRGCHRTRYHEGEIDALPAHPPRLALS